METIRCFIAVELPFNVKSDLSLLGEQIKQGNHRFVKWVDPQSIHITLKFLGNVSHAIVPKIIEEVSAAVQRASPLSLSLEQTGAFPNWRQPQVIWVGLGGQVEKLVDLQTRLEKRLIPLGFQRESRSFIPHLTIARVRDGVSPTERQNFGKWVSSTKIEHIISFEVNSVSVMQSQLSSGGAVYSRLGEAKLGD